MAKPKALSVLWLAYAGGEGYPTDPNFGSGPFRGYYFQILTRQGENASGGAKNYVVNGKMTRGFAFLAYPVEYASLGSDDLHCRSRWNCLSEGPRPQYR